MDEHFDQYGFLYNEVTINILKWLRQNQTRINSTKSAIASNIEATYSHATKQIDRLAEAGLLDLTKERQSYNCQLTDSGKKVADQFIETINIVEQQVKP